MTNDATQNSDRYPQASWLAQKLQRRVGESAGVINVRQLPIEQTQATIHRMVERERLPSQIESRYQAVGVVTPIKMTGRSRVETLDQGTPALVTPTLPPTLQRASLPTQERTPVIPMPHWEPPPPAPISSPPPQTFRVSRKLTVDAIAPPVSAQTIGESSSVAVSHRVTESVPPAPRLESSAVTERVRVQRLNVETLRRREGSDASWVMAQPPAQAAIELSTPSPIAAPIPTETVSTPSESLQRQLAAPEQPTHAGEAATSSPYVTVSPLLTAPSTAPLPLMIARSLVPTPVAETEPTSEGVAPRSTGETANTPRIQATLGEMGRSAVGAISTTAMPQPLVIARLVNPASNPETARVQKKAITLGNTASAPSPPPLRVSPQSSERSSTLPLPSTTVIIQPLTQSASESGVNSVLRRHPAPELIARSPLPLHTQVPAGTISRQTEPTVVAEAVPTPATPSPPPPAEKAAPEPGPDVKQMAEQVSRILMRQLVVERERRGMQRW